MPRIFVIGALVYDIVFNVPDWVRPNRAVHADRLTLSPGGKGLNQAVAASRLGADARLVGCVGRDLFGDALLAALQEAGVDSGAVRRHETARTSIAGIVVRDRVPGFIGAPDASRKITAADIRAALSSLRADDVLLLGFEIPQPLVQLALQIGRAAGAKTVLNPAPFFTRDAFVLNYLGLVDVIIPNKLEAQLLTAGSPDEVADADDGDDVDDVDALAQRLLDLGVGQVVMTIGEAGSRFFAGARQIAQPAFALEVVDTTGASDAFVGAYCLGLTEGWRVERILEFASAAAGLACTRHGTMRSLPGLAAVRRLLAERD